MSSDKVSLTLENVNDTVRKVLQNNGFCELLMYLIQVTQIVHYSNMKHKLNFYRLNHIITEKEGKEQKKIREEVLFSSYITQHLSTRQKKMRNTFSTSRVPFSFMCFSLDLDIIETEEKILF